MLPQHGNQGVILVSGADRGESDVLISSDDARDLAQELIEAADEVDEADRRLRLQNRDE